MEIKDHLIKEIDTLDEKQLNELEEYVSFLKFRSRFKPSIDFNKKQIAQLYKEFGEEDRLLAEEGMSDYRNMLSREDR